MPPKPEAKVICTCGCKGRVSPRTERRHLAGQATLRAQATAFTQNPNLAAANNPNVFNPTPLPSVRQPVTESHQAIFPSNVIDEVVMDEGPPMANLDVDANVGSTSFNRGDDVDMILDIGDEDLDGPDEVHMTIRNLRSIGTHLTGATPGEYESDDSDDGTSLGPEAEGREDDDDGIDWFGERDSDDSDDGEINEDFERELVEFSEEFSDADLALLRHFALKTESHMTNDTFEKLPFAFPESEIASFKVTRARAEFLAAFTPVAYDCCINSCCCYAGPHAEATHCPYCKEPRHNTQGKPRKKFTYVPLIPRLKGYYRNAPLVEQLRYRHNFVSDANTIRDVYDGKHYKRLQTERVVIDGQERRHQFFADSHDIALGLSTDGFAPFRRRKKTCWPLLIYNYNLPPEIRFLCQYILCIGVIPGPYKPKDFDSFFWLAIEELIKFAMGVGAFDVTEKERFTLHAFLIVVFGDIPAVSMVMKVKGHNGLSPCRMCKIRGLRIPNIRATTHYVPLERSRHPDVRNNALDIKKYDPNNLPLRTHAEMMDQAHVVQFATSITDSEEWAKEFGIKGISILSQLPSISYPISFPYDFMHLIFENVIKNLILLWTGNFKGLDEGSESYELPKKVWEAIGTDTASSGSTIPYAFGARPPNVADDKTATTAETWSFWMQYIGPILLVRKFEKAIYYDHFVNLVKLVRICLQFEITRDELAKLRTGFAEWVEKYEQIYYQYLPDRLSTCPLTTHALLHISDGIDDTGPVWTAWAFPTERFCGRLQPAIKSRRHPFASIDNYIVANAQLSQIKIVYDLHLELSLKPRKNDHVIGQFSHPDYPTCILLPPQKPSSTISAALGSKIVIGLSTRFNKSVTTIRQYFSLQNVQQWGRVRRLEGGDDMYASSLNQPAEDRRDATFVRYDLLIDKNAKRRCQNPDFEIKTFYGQLQNIFVVHLLRSAELGLEQPTSLVLGGIKSCTVTAKNSLGMPYYSDHGRYEVVDITAVQCLIGRVRIGNKWGIVDRSGNLVQTYFVTE